MKVHYSNTYSAKTKRISNLPKRMELAISGAVKRDILGIKKEFHDGIKNNTLGLEKLAARTVQAKARSGFPKPNSPLYGKGDGSPERSYSNMLLIRKLKGGWKLYPSKRKHWSGNITLDNLFKIHEFGAVIKQKRGDKTVMIRIPPRPALLLSYRRVMIRKQKNKMETAKDVKKAITDYVNRASEAKIKELEKWECRIDV